MQYLWLVGALLGVAIGQSVVEQSDDGSSGSIKFTAPDLSDEESHSPFMPDMLKCDACRVVALQVRTLPFIACRFSPRKLIITCILLSSLAPSTNPSHCAVGFMYLQ
jgi:hypothetical protein